MNNIIVVYHSGYGHTKKLAERVAKGAGAELMPVAEIDWGKLEKADAIIMGTPTYMGTISAEFKRFMDDSSKTWMAQKWKDKIAGGFTNSHSPSGDKLNTLQTLVTFALQHGMIWIGNTGMNDGTHNRLGSFTGAMAQSENAPPEQTPPESDLMTGELYGKRIAEMTAKFKR